LPDAGFLRAEPLGEGVTEDLPLSDGGVSADKYNSIAMSDYDKNGLNRCVGARGG